MSDGAPTDLADHVVIVTGATRGIGLGVARHLGGLGVRVVITGRKQGRLDAASAELGELGVEHLAVRGDVADRDADSDPERF